MDSTTLVMARLAEVLKGATECLEEGCLGWLKGLLEEGLDLADAVKHAEWGEELGRSGGMPALPECSRGLNGASRRQSTEQIEARIREVAAEEPEKGLFALPGHTAGIHQARRASKCSSSKGD